MIGKSLILIVLTLSSICWSTAQPGANTLHFSLLNDEEVRGTNSHNRYALSVFSVDGAKYAEILNNRFQSERKIDKTGFTIDLGWGSGARKVIRVARDDELMWIDIHASGYHNLRLDSVQFVPGYYTINEIDFIDDLESQIEPISIKPEEWVSNTNSPLKQMVFPVNWDRWGPTDIIVSIATDEGVPLNPKSKNDYEVNISCEDHNGEKYQHQIVDSKANERGLLLDTGFVANFSHQQYFTVHISITREDETMLIKVYTNWLKSLGLYNIEFRKGTFFIDVDKVFNEDRYTGVPPPSKNHYEQRYNITPADWGTFKEDPK